MSYPMWAGGREGVEGEGERGKWWERGWEGGRVEGREEERGGEREGNRTLLIHNM